MRPALPRTPLPQAPPRGPYALLILLYVAGGLPGSVLRDALPGVLRAEGADLTSITALVADLGLAWTLKFLWAPLVDRFGARRRWIVAAQAGMAAVFLGLVAAFHGLSLSEAGEVPTLPIVLLAAVALGSATQDVASDAWTMDAFVGPRRARANGLRIGAYRVGMVIGGGFLVARAADWGTATLWVGPALLLSMAALACLRLPSPPRPAPERLDLVQVLRRMLVRPGVGVAIAFALLYRVGDQAMAGLVRPFLVDRGFTAHEIGDLYTPLTIGSAIAGATLGGVLTSRLGVLRALLVLGAAQALSNLGFAAAAATGSTPLTWVAAAVEPFCGGLGSAAFVTFLMGACDPRHAAAHYAMWTALMGLSGWAATRWSGAFAQSTGYTAWFATTFALALPALALLPWLARSGFVRPATGDARPG